MDENIYLNNDLLELEGLDYIRENIWSNNCYTNNEVPIPRVTHILSKCQDQSGLIEWAARIGITKQKYYREKALEVGTVVHELIDQYLLWLVSPQSYNGEFEVNYDEYRSDYRESIYNAFNNFKVWTEKLKANNTPIQEVLFLEEKVTCPWFGGTVDGIVRINGATYLIDFKTSKQISTEYLIQTSAYMWMINNGYAPHIPHIDGIGIIRVDKSKMNSFEELFLNDFNPYHHSMIDSFQKCFGSYVNSYYRAFSCEYMADKYNKQYITFDAFKENKPNE